MVYSVNAILLGALTLLGWPILCRHAKKAKKGTKIAAEREAWDDAMFLTTPSGRIFSFHCLPCSLCEGVLPDPDRIKLNTFDLQGCIAFDAL